MDNFDVKSYITNKMREFGIPASLRGYEYARYAVMLCVDDSDYIHNITKKLYPKVAEKYGAMDSSVARAIRHVIDIVYDRGNIEALNAVFAGSTNPAKGQPTNKEFIATLADNIRMELKIV